MPLGMAQNMAAVKGANCLRAGDTSTPLGMMLRTVCTNLEPHGKPDVEVGYYVLCESGVR